MPCTPCGAAEKRRQRGISEENLRTVSAEPFTAGMPRYKVTAPDGTTHEFDTYQSARVWKANNGGKLRAV